MTLGRPSQFKQVNEGNNFFWFALEWNSPQPLHAELCSLHTKAAGTRLAALGLDTGARFPVSTQLPRARLHPLPGLQLLAWPLFEQIPMAPTWRPSRYPSVGHGAHGLLGGRWRIPGQLLGERQGGHPSAELRVWRSAPEEAQTFLARVASIDAMHTQLPFWLKK